MEIMGNMENRFDTLIRGGTAIMENGAVQANIGIRDGRIAALLDPAVPFEAEEVIEAGGLVVFPGLIDPHVHLWEPGPLSYREDFRHGSQASAAGGVTTLIEMPLSIPPVIDEASFRLKLDTATANSVVDFALWGGLIPRSIRELKHLHELGCIGFKAFMSYANDEYPHTPDHHLLEAMYEIAKFGGLVGVHAENADVVKYWSEKLERQGVRDADAYADGRPAVAELDAMQRVILFAGETGCRLHIVHMTVAEGGEMVNRAKARGVRVSNETCPHYLLFDKSALAEKGVFAKCNPPLRSAENREALWEQLFKGNIDCIGSDHGPYTDEEKTASGGDIWSAPPGFGGIELILPTMISEGYHKRGLSLERIALLTSTNAAKIFGLYPRKGSIRVGSDADLVLADLNETWTYRGESSFSKTKTSHSIYDGVTFKGRVKTTLVRGRKVYDQAAIVVTPGYGEFIPAGTSSWSYNR
jgi:allantoinase